MDKYTASEVYNSMGYRDAQVVLADEAQAEIDAYRNMLERLRQHVHATVPIQDEVQALLNKGE